MDDFKSALTYVSVHHIHVSLRDTKLISSYIIKTQLMHVSEMAIIHSNINHFFFNLDIIL